jgi:chaperone modulatory protein CbpM
MTDHLTEDDVLAALPRLTRTRLVTFVEAEMVIPLRRERHGASTLVFRQIDFARLRLLCDLTDDLDLDIAALDVVVSLIDQLHATRQQLKILARAIAAEPADVRTRIASAIPPN